MTNLTQHVVDSLNTLRQAYLPDELAYLALTQKVEHAFRDKLAFQLHKRLSDELLVCREWCRTDLAIVRNTQPLLLLEAKAIYTFDILKGGAQHPYPNLLRQDVEKAHALQTEGRSPSLEVLALLVATHPHDPPNAACRDAVKYYDGVVKYATQGITIEAANKMVQSQVNLPLLHHGEVPGGKAFGIGVSVAYWLFSAY